MTYTSAWSGIIVLLLTGNPGLLPAQKKADRKIMANLQEHVTYLSGHSDSTASYIGQQFAAIPIATGNGSSAYLQPFSIDEGKQVMPATAFSINDIPVTDFYPMPYSANAHFKGASIIGVQEMNKPWIINISEITDGSQGDTASLLYSSAKQAQDNGATAVIFYNPDSSIANIPFDKTDKRPALHIPVLYAGHTVAGRFFTDAAASVKLSGDVLLGEKVDTGNNVIGYINNNAPYTALISAYCDNSCDDAALIEIARLLKQGEAKQHNYLFVVLPGKGPGTPGFDYFTRHPVLTPDKTDYIISLNNTAISNASPTLRVGGTGSSPQWSVIIRGIKSRKLEVSVDSVGGAQAAVFYGQQVPFLTLSGVPGGNAGNNINYSGEVEKIRYIVQLIESADRMPRLAFTAN